MNANPTLFRLRSLWDLKIIRARFSDPGLQALVRSGHADSATVRGEPDKLDYMISAKGLVVANEKFRRDE